MSTKDLHKLDQNHEIVQMTVINFEFFTIYIENFDQFEIENSAFESAKTQNL